MISIISHPSRRRAFTMSKDSKFSRWLFFLLLLWLGSLNTFSQQVGQPPSDEDVIRVDTSLVQTDISVFDKQGHFIEGLKPEQFVLKVDGKPQPIAFFDQVAAGSANEEAQLAAARGQARTDKGMTAGPVALDRGRTIVFFVDDLHMAFDSLKRAREALLRYVDNEMGQTDQAVMTSASGSIGFLQQVTDEKAVLKKAVSRLAFKPYVVSDMQRPPMTEYQAINIDRRDLDTLGYFVDQYIRDNPGTTRESAEMFVTQRARAVLVQAASITRNTLATVVGLTKSLGELPGRKLLIFVSDGFFLDSRNSDSIDQIRRITDQSRRASVVIYSIDARGLISGFPDAGTDMAFDPSGRLARSGMGEISASQDGMNALAVDTGGKAFRNNNDFKMQVTKSLNETSSYYLLAWRPEDPVQKSSRFRKIEISIPQRPDLSVRVRSGFFQSEPASKSGEPARPVKKSPVTNDDELRAAISSRLPKTSLPVSLTTNYVMDVKKGAILSASIEVDAHSMVFQPSADKQVATVDTAGIVFDDQGKPAGSFREQLKVSAKSEDQVTSARHGLAYTFQTPIKPGLYQVRIGVRDENSKRLGSASQWVEVPDVATNKLVMSSLLLAEREKPSEADNTAEKSTKATEPLTGPLSITRVFKRSSFLRFITFIYNPKSGGDSKPDVAVQVQIFRDNQPVLTTAARKVPTQDITDLSTLPYAAEAPLQGLPTGRYALQVTAIDRIAKSSTTQRVVFRID
jgi:VWFA-related protein